MHPHTNSEVILISLYLCRCLQACTATVTIISHATAICHDASQKTSCWHEAKTSLMCRREFNTIWCRRAK